MKGYEIFNKELGQLRKYLSQNSIDEKAINIVKQKLDAIPFFSAFNYKTTVDRIQRVTINKRIFKSGEQRIDEIKFLKYPPTEFVTKYGRANLPQESVLYGTFEPITALSEMRPEVGDIITISTWQLTSKYDLTLCPIFKISSLDNIVHNRMSLVSKIHYNKMLRQLDCETAIQIDMLHQFVADCFAKITSPKNHFDYFMSAYYANKILYSFEDGSIDAIFYPSVRQSLTMTNIAIKPAVFDANYTLAMAEESIIRQIPVNNGGWVLDGTAQSNQFQNGRIIWNS